MTGRRLVTLSALAFAFGCQDSQLPTGPKAAGGRSAIVSDGAHGGNQDFFFLPPLLKLKKNDPNFELGSFNNTLQPHLKVVICELQAEASTSENPLGLPKDATPCVTTVKTFAPGSVQLVTLPTARRDIPKEFRHEEWWRGPKRSREGFYYVLWDTRQPNLDLDQFYRIRVLIAGPTPASDVLLGFADVDPKAKGGPKWKYSRTRDVIDMVDNVKLPIPFRVENDGVECSALNRCIEVTVPNNNPEGEETVVTIDGGVGAIAGASFPNGWLRSGGDCTPETCPQSVVVTITEVPSGETDEFSRTRTIPCHVGLPLQQFNKCFNFTTTPTLALIDGEQFARAVTVAVCYALESTEDPRRDFAQLYSSGPNEPAHALEEVSDEGILGAGGRNCSVTNSLALRSSKPLTRFASIGWSKLKGGLAAAFGVKTAYAVDVGLGGLVKRFSNIGPALSAEIEAFPTGGGEGPTELLLDERGVATGQARIVATHVHAGEEEPELHGLNKVPVTFTVASGNGTLRQLNTEGDEGPSVTVMTAFLSNLEVDGIASVEWTPPSVPGTYEMIATGPTTNGPIEFSVTVPPLGAGIAAGLDFGCAILVGGVGSCWGANHNGQLGDGSEVERVTTPVIVAGNHNFIEISATNLTACGVTVAHAAYCWGYNAFGQIGDGTTQGRRTPVAVAGNHRFRSISAGFRMSCGLSDAGKAFCWGTSVEGAGGLGDGVTTASSVPVEVAHQGAFKSITVGLLHACALDMEGAAHCWGSNAFRALGTGNTVSQMAPAAVVGGHTFTSLVAGNTKTCGVKSDGSAWCWGQHFFGEMGTGSVTSSIHLTPTQVNGNIALRSFVPGAANDVFTASCGISTSGAASCWGANNSGQLGGLTPDATCTGPQSVTLGCSATPLAVQGNHVFRELSVGGEFACGITSGRQIVCWGKNNFGQLGNTTTEFSNGPGLVATPTLAQ